MCTTKCFVTVSFLQRLDSCAGGGGGSGGRGGGGGGEREPVNLRFYQFWLVLLV